MIASARDYTFVPMLLPEQLGVFENLHRAVPKGLQLPDDALRDLYGLLPEDDMVSMDTISCLYFQHYTQRATNQLYAALRKGCGISDCRLPSVYIPPPGDWKLDKSAYIYEPGVYVVDINFLPYHDETVEKVRSLHPFADYHTAANEVYAAIALQGPGFVKKLSGFASVRIIVGGLNIESEFRYDFVPCLECQDGDSTIYTSGVWSHHKPKVSVVPSVGNIELLRSFF